MSARDALIADFLHGAGWATAHAEPMAGDASARRYLRLTAPDGTRAVLMDAPPDTASGTAEFVRMAGYLTAHGFSAPDILARAPQDGLLLLEDLGDAVFARVLTAEPAREIALYTAATDCLAALHRCPPAPGLIKADAAYLAAAIAPLFEHYAPATDHPVGRSTRDAIRDGLAHALDRHAGVPDVTILRDFHAENLIWMPGRSGVAQVGLLDFQDALAGHRAYDLVSLTQDARRDLAPDTEARVIAHYLSRTGCDSSGFLAAHAVLGLQRNLRILGIFARLARDLGKPRYLALAPRVWRHIRRNLGHPALSDLAGLIDSAIPAPTPGILDRIARHEA